MNPIREALGNSWRRLKVNLTPVPVGKRWVFIVGCYNSGTTLFANMLGSHPDIAGLPTEGHFITDEFITDWEMDIPRMWCKREDIFRLNAQSTGPDPKRVMKEWAMRMDTSKPLLLEKSPPNTPRTLWLQEHFEDAHFIALVRNGYAVAEGIRRKAEPKQCPDGWPIADCARQWLRSYEVIDEDSVGLKKLQWLKYEDLVADPPKHLNELAEFLGISPFDHLDGTESWSIHERDEKIRDLNRASIDRLSPADIDDINEVAGYMLDRFGYERLPGTGSSD